VLRREPNAASNAIGYAKHRRPQGRARIVLIGRNDQKQAARNALAIEMRVSYAVMESLMTST